MFKAFGSFRPSFNGKRNEAVSIPVGAAPDPSCYEGPLFDNGTPCEASKLSCTDSLTRDKFASLVLKSTWATEFAEKMAYPRSGPWDKV